MSEILIAQGIQAVIQGLSEFADADVVLNDWRILDGPGGDAPFVLIATSDFFDSQQGTRNDVTVWEIPVMLFERWTDWKTTLDNFRVRRQAILDAFNAVGTARSAGGLEATDINRIRNEGPIRNWYDPYVEDPAQATPLYLFQVMLFTAEEY